MRWLGGEHLQLLYRSVSDPQASPSYAVEVNPERPLDAIESDQRCDGRPFELQDLARGVGPPYVGAAWSLPDGTPVVIHPPQSGPTGPAIRSTAAQFLAFCASLRPPAVATTLAFGPRQAPAGWIVQTSMASTLSLGRPGSSPASWIVVELEGMAGLDSADLDGDLIVTATDGSRSLVLPRDGQLGLTVTAPALAGLSIGLLIEFAHGVTVLPNALPLGY